MNNQNNYTTEKKDFHTYCDEIIDNLVNSMSSSSSGDRQLDVSIAKVQDIFKNGAPEEKNYMFELVFERFQFFIKKQISNLFVANMDREDLMQEATMCFYNSILDYDINRGAFIYFTRKYIQRNIWSLISKSRKHVKNNITFVSIDSFSNEDSKNNYDDHLYYQMTDNVNVEDTIVTKEQTMDCLNQMEEILTEREKIAMYLYLKKASYEEIAEMCGISEKSVDNSLHRAKSKLKNLYKNEEMFY